MKFSYKLIAVILVALLVLGIYRLGVENNAEALEDDQTAYNKTENIYFWYSDASLEEFFTGAAVAFHEENEDVRVIPVLVTSEEYLEYVNEASVAGENYPDVFMITNEQLEKAYLAGLASQIDDSTDVVNRAHFSKVAENAVTYHGKKVAYPLYFETSVLVYNKTYLNRWIKKVKEEGLPQEDDSEIDPNEIDPTNYGGDAVGEESIDGSKYDVETLSLEDLIPATIDDIKSFADVYDAPEGVEGVFKWDVSDVFYNYFFVGNYMVIGGESGDDATNVNIYNEDTIKCMNVYQNLNQFFSIDAETSSYDKMIEDFIDGKFVYSIATSDVIERLKNAEVEAAAKLEEEKRELDANIKEWNAEVAVGEMSEDDMKAAVEKAESNFTSPYEFGYARVPMISDELKSKSLSVTDVAVVNGYSEHKHAANRFAAFLTTKYADRIYSKTGKIAASTDANYDDATLLLFQEEYANSMPLPKLIEASNFWVQLEITFFNAWKGNDVDALLTTLSKQIETQIAGTQYKEDKEPDGDAEGGSEENTTND
ncbi:MAG: extracellular solute-binding protein [Lachnospiraceae bacterium]|nr:extracellular solute-binding protein [Lachnospiraceae bacterium]